uniref:RNA-directed DNA polymerase from mobile element jockey n=1 Tax=Sipha flava TaxID=143950 RepID=A0A2S2QNX7_9HEMI
MINQAYPCEEIILNTDIEAIAVTIILPHTNITICNMYIPNKKEFTLSDIEQIVHRLPYPFIIVGDFNSHSKTWGSYKTDLKGKIIEELLSNDLITILNNGQPTRTNPSNGYSSAIDLSLANTSFSHKLDWQTLPDIYSSDHIPIKIT